MSPELVERFRKAISSNKAVDWNNYHYYSSVEPYVLLGVSDKVDENLRFSKKHKLVDHFIQICGRSRGVRIFNSLEIEILNNNDKYFLNTTIHKSQTLSKNSGFVFMALKVADQIHCVTSFSKWLSYEFDQENQFNVVFEKNRDYLKKLTNRELEVIMLLSRGKKRSQIAKDLSVSIYTYDNHKRNINKKLTHNQLIETLNAFK